MSKSSGHQGRYIVQKYIERPFLIYETKFDIRQWFLVTSWNPLHVWMYRDSYLRFCSRPFTLSCGHESIHLCNNAVQARYTNAERSHKLPHDNMWDNKMFHQFLKEQGHGDKWNSLIYPTMKKCLISKLTICKIVMFGLHDQFSTWLLSIYYCYCGRSKCSSITDELSQLP